MLFLVYNKEFSVYFLLAHNRVSSSTLHKMWKRVKFTSDSDGNHDDINKTLCIKTNLQLCSISQISHARVQKEPLASYHGYPRILFLSWKKVS
jgi:hypothetical protein